ncbi:MAG: hypothetical protein ABI811_14375 [Acidobacteriota bacterium]
MHYRWLMAAALALYCLAGALLIAQNPGLQYDEALLVAGGVALRHPSPVQALQATPDTWICRHSLCFPLMAEGAYIGAIKEILSVPAFVLAGPRPWVVRAVSMALTLLGLWGIMSATKALAGPAIAGCLGLILAVNPSFINMTVFDNGAVAATICALGLLALAACRYSARPTVAAMFWIGAAAGFAMWTRANLIWTLAAIALSLAVVLRRGIIVPLSHAAALIAGVLAGGLPLWIYQIVSRGGTFAAMGLAGQATGNWAELLHIRLIMLSEVLLLDAEHTVMWGTSVVPAWLRWTSLALITAAAIACLAIGRRFARITALSFLLLIAFLFASRLQIAEHHLISVVPFAAAVSVLAAAALVQRFPQLRLALVLMTTLYAGFCVYWLAREVQGLRETGGLLVWSDAISELAGISEAKAAGRVVKAVDWGFSDNLYVLSDGRLMARDAFNLEHPSISLAGRPWPQEIQEGGLFLISGSENRQFSAPVDEFLKALRETQPVFAEQTIATRQGTTYARLIDIQRDTLGQGKPASFSETFDVNLANPSSDSQLTGLYPADGQPWRWSGPRFSVNLNRGSIGAPWLDVQLFVPEASIEKLSRITLTGRVGSHQLPHETFTRAGEFTYSRPIDAAWFTNGSATVEFELDKWLPASPADSRELGLVVRSIRLHAR